MKIAIRNGHVVDPANGIDEVTDLTISRGCIESIGKIPDDLLPEETIDATGKLVIPGIIDLCARLGEPGYEYKADIDSESRAAVSAGITTLCCPPDTLPAIDSPADIEFIEQRQKEVNLARIEVIASLTRDLKGEQLSEMASLKEAGCVGVSNVRRPFANSNVLLRALEYASSHDLTAFILPEDDGLAHDGCAHEGPVSTRLGLPAIPEAAETAAIGFYLPLIKHSGVRAHFCRISTASGLNILRRAKHDGLPISMDVCAHQLFLTEMDVADFNSLCHTRPPLRSERDRDALREGLANNSVDAICSDHHPHDLDAKLAPFESTEPGISSLETLLSLCLRLVDQGHLSLSQAIAQLTHQPAEILKIDRGRLGVGDLADLCIVDPQAEWECDPVELLSRGKNSPFGGWLFKGRVETTFVGGKVVFRR
jgi:dihydroorotase